MSEGFVLGHDFSRAEPRRKKTRPLGPEAENRSPVEFVNGFLIHHASRPLKKSSFEVF